MSARRPTTTERGRVSLLGAALVVGSATLLVEAGPLGVGVAVVSVAVALASEGVYGVALLHLGLVGLAGTPTVVGLVLLEAASVFLLVADTPPGDRIETGALVVPVAVALAVGTATLAESRGLLTAATVLVVVVALGTYLVHRYGRVRLGLAARELET